MTAFPFFLTALFSSAATSLAWLWWYGPQSRRLPLVEAILATARDTVNSLKARIAELEAREHYLFDRCCDAADELQSAGGKLMAALQERDAAQAERDRLKAGGSKPPAMYNGAIVAERDEARRDLAQQKALVLGLSEKLAICSTELGRCAERAKASDRWPNVDADYADFLAGENKRLTAALAAEREPVIGTDEQEGD